MSRIEAGGKEEEMLSGNKCFVIRDTALRELYGVLCAEDVPSELKQLQLREYEDHLCRRERQIKLSFLTELLWLTGGAGMDAWETAFQNREKPVHEGMAVDVDCLVKAASFALGVVTEEEVYQILQTIKGFKENGVETQEMPFL